MAVVSFSEASYYIKENGLELKVSIARSGDTERLAVVLVASETFVGTASGKYYYSGTYVIL